MSDTIGVLNEYLSNGFENIKATTKILKQRVQENIARLEVSSDKHSWGHTLAQIKTLIHSEIRNIYNDVFGVDVTQITINKSNQKQLTLILVACLLLLSSVVVRVFSLWTLFTMSLLLISVKTLYGTAVMLQAGLYMFGLVLLGINYCLMYPVQCLVLLLTWQLAKYLVWLCSPGNGNTVDAYDMERRLISVEQRLERMEFQIRTLRQSLRELTQ